METMPKADKEAVVEIVTSWMEQGLEQGLEQGRREGLQEGLSLALDLTARFGEAGTALAARLGTARPEQLAAFKERLLSGDSLAELAALLG